MRTRGFVTVPGDDFASAQTSVGEYLPTDILDAIRLAELCAEIRLRV
jgi:hypothetical protein